jgi:ubiquinone/menaquinone biosynthesis C-methylase UbiE
MSVEARVVAHYDAGGLLAGIEAGLAELGTSTQDVTVEDLGPVDEFHIGGRVATSELCERMGLRAQDHLLDVGCGIGGTARFVAATLGCRVTGVDLSPDYVAVAEQLTEWTGLAGRVRYEQASALDLPFADGTFDGAVQIHVGMNIEDKAAMFAEVCRVLRPGARFGLYDVMRLGEAEPTYPVPWAADAATSFLAAPDDYRAALEAAGFAIEGWRDRREFAVEFFAAMRARTAERGGPPPLGLHVLIGPEAPTRIANMVDALAAGIVAPVEVVCSVPSR